MNFINNPFEIVIQAVKELYPEIIADIQFNPMLRGKDFEECGCTTFPDDGSTPLVDISTNIPFEHMPEILAHELAHVVAGADHEHDEIWEDVFHKISEKYEQIFTAKFS